MDGVHAALAKDPADHLLPPERLAALPAYAAVAVGRREGRLTRSAVSLDAAAFEPANFLTLTSAVQALTVRHLLDGSIAVRGVHRVEEAIELSGPFERA